MKTENDPAYLMMRDPSAGFEALFFRNENGIMLVGVDSILRWMEHGALMNPNTIIASLSSRAIDAEDEITKRQAAFVSGPAPIKQAPHTDGSECKCFEPKIAIIEAPCASQEQILELWKAVTVTAVVMCLGFCVLVYRMIYG